MTAISVYTARSYYLLTKPGIILGNLITMAGGFALASAGKIDPSLFLATLLGLGLVIASACVWNNYIDRSTDKKMARTKERALVTGAISIPGAIRFAICLGLLGTLFLYFFTNLLATLLALVGFFVYVLFYSFSKQHTQYATLIGSIAGAIPPVVGYCAAGNRFDLGALLLFSMLVFWQMPHFYAIAIGHLKEYTAASLPLLPVIKGVQRTKIHMLLYILAFTLTTPLLTLFGYAGYTFLIASFFLNTAWLVLALEGFSKQKERPWARNMFLLSLTTLLLLNAILII